jgi:hypothetical protein
MPNNSHPREREDRSKLLQKGFKVFDALQGLIQKGFKVFDAL